MHKSVTMYQKSFDYIHWNATNLLISIAHLKNYTTVITLIKVAYIYIFQQIVEDLVEKINVQFVRKYLIQELESYLTSIQCIKI